MLAKLFTYSLFGIEAEAVEVEVDISPGAMPKSILVGLAEAAVRESTHRIERALVNSGYTRPIDRIVINLSPADLPKEAASFDLPMALGMLAASGQLQSDRFDDYAAVGELALDGSLRPIKGTLSMALAAKQKGKRGLIVPTANASEAAVVGGIEAISVGSLAEAVGFFSGQLPIEPVVFDWKNAMTEFGNYHVNFSDVKGQEMAKRAVTVAAAGAHHLLMIGSPGTGKTLLAQRIGSILPDLEPEESLETTRIYSALGRLAPDQSLVMLRPFRAPHHTVSELRLSNCASSPNKRSRIRETLQRCFELRSHQKSKRQPFETSSSRKASLVIQISDENRPLQTRLVSRNTKSLARSRFDHSRRLFNHSGDGIRGCGFSLLPFDFSISDASSTRSARSSDSFLSSKGRWSGFANNRFSDALSIL